MGPHWPAECCSLSALWSFIMYLCSQIAHSARCGFFGATVRAKLLAQLLVHKSSWVLRQVDYELFGQRLKHVGDAVTAEVASDRALVTGIRVRGRRGKLSGLW